MANVDRFCTRLVTEVATVSYDSKHAIEKFPQNNQGFSRVGSLPGIPYHTPVGSDQGDPGRPVILENLLTRTDSTCQISNTV